MHRPKGGAGFGRQVIILLVEATVSVGLVIKLGTGQTGAGNRIHGRAGRVWSDTGKRRLVEYLILQTANSVAQLVPTQTQIALLPLFAEVLAILGSS